ncbi:MAG: helix-turn-helix domain-containing protein [Roseburia faecis]
MSKYIPGNQKHLTLEDRKYIEKSLNAGCSFKDIAMPESKMFYRKLI